MWCTRLGQQQVLRLAEDGRVGRQVYKNHTGLDSYVAYMLGGGYLMSADVVRALMVVKDTIALKHTPIEDATIGMWLTGMDLRAVNHPRSVPQGCCVRC